LLAIWAAWDCRRSGREALFCDVSIFASTDPAATALEPDDAAITLIKNLQPKL
jgi:hypothetical protein